MIPQTQLLAAPSLDRSSLSTYVVEHFKGAVAYPINALNDVDALREAFLEPLRRALPNIQRHPLIALTGDDQGARWEIGTGYWVGTMTGSLLGMPAAGRTVFIRYTEMLRLEGQRIAQWYVIPDFLDLMDQLGVNPLRPSLGASGRILPPMTGTALYPGGDGQQSINLVMAMLANLGEYDGENLESMNLAGFWAPDFLWYGPAGIGTTRGIDGFRAHHQGPFLRAFPDRIVDHHAATVAAGDFAATGGWPHMHASHNGGGWLGLPPTGRHIELRVMDIWRREGDLLRENWVGIDIIHMLAQLELDVFDQMQGLLQARS